MSIRINGSSLVFCTAANFPLNSVYWTSWKDDADPDDGDDVELPPDAYECKRPLSIQVQTIDGVNINSKSIFLTLLHWMKSI